MFLKQYVESYAFQRDEQCFMSFVSHENIKKSYAFQEEEQYEITQNKDLKRDR